MTTCRKAFILFIILCSGCGPLPSTTTVKEIKNRDGMEMVFVPAGYFDMGSGLNDANADEDEQPVHKVYLDGYWIDKTEVTNSMYQQCISAEVCTRPAQTKFHTNPEYSNHPVIGVSWDQANIYCEWAGRRLPTEAEWEKAARGTDGRIYPWGNDPPSNSLLNYNHLVNKTTPVGTYPAGASAYGALDMAGNAWEWVADGYSQEYYSISASNNPISESPVNRRVLRGGNWDSNAEGVRAANRFWAFPGRNDTDGFRCAQSE